MTSASRTRLAGSHPLSSLIGGGNIDAVAACYWKKTADVISIFGNSSSHAACINSSARTYLGALYALA